MFPRSQGYARLRLLDGLTVDAGHTILVGRRNDAAAAFWKRDCVAGFVALEHPAGLDPAMARLVPHLHWRQSLQEVGFNNDAVKARLGGVRRNTRDALEKPLAH